MLKDIKVTTMYNGKPYVKKDEIMVLSYDYVIQIPDFYIVSEILMKNDCFSKYFNFNKFGDINEYTIQPPILDRTKKNILEWLLKPEFKDKVDCEGLYNTIRETYGEEIYKNAEITDLAKSIPILLSQKYIKKIYILTDNCGKKAKIDKLIGMLSIFAYRVNIVFLDEPFEDYVAREIHEFTNIFHDDSSIIKKIEEKNCCDLSTISFGIANLGYNFEKFMGYDLLNNKYNLTEECAKKGYGLAYYDVKTFDDKYFAIG